MDGWHLSLVMGCDCQLFIKENDDDNDDDDDFKTVIIFWCRFGLAMQHLSTTTDDARSMCDC